ncbi:hypothetical protein LTR56_005548 [Elasticomyces elasticus]|nr:hypothetical protein LTR22_017135 [Elasticomyces elasticus]KAK3651740.1 hypothetical protein LTR56_005548 [Elasticomyces elasticus]KAK4913355.1 hypothetical protein LTR49_018336 [Elasticomyces elasticus]KAK5769161.1 hypothetical protein LTS12_000512 [Elasticomyces elasticus]
MARRSSARLQSRRQSTSTSTPKRVSLSHDQPGRTPRTVPNRKLESLEEHDDEMPGSFPTSPPTESAPMRHAEEEKSMIGSMKPKMREALQKLGAMTEPAKSKTAPQHQETPTKVQKSDITAPAFEFTFRREHSLELSPEAKRLMGEMRERMARVSQLPPTMESSDNESGNTARKVATPKAKKHGRFSEAHKEVFGKMDSIASHPAALRAVATKTTTTKVALSTGEETRSLKRSLSKAQLDDSSSTPPRGLQRSPSKHQLGSQLPRAASSHALPTNRDMGSPSPTKRVKMSATVDVSAMRPTSSSSSYSSRPSTPQQSNTLRMHPSNPNMALAYVASPTQASLAREKSIKAAKHAATSAIPTPMKGLTRSPSKAALVHREEAQESGPLLARSPFKAALFDRPATHKAEQNVLDDDGADALPLLARTPAKGGHKVFPKPATDKAEDGGSPLLLRSPLKPHAPAKSLGCSEKDVQVQAVKPAPLLQRSPMKMSHLSNPFSTTSASSSTTAQQQPEDNVPLLARSPSKIALPTNPTTTQVSTATPGKSSGGGLLSRFNLLRRSPVRGILRSTSQRLYSDDPRKVAEGTHFATPPKMNLSRADSTESARKKVDFSTSTKARYDGKEKSETPSSSVKAPTSTRKDMHGEDETTNGDENGGEMEVDYPTLPEENEPPIPSPSPQKPSNRRQTITPGDFTFRADGHGAIRFGDSPAAAAKNAGRPSGRMSIRHVEPEPETALPAAPPTAQGSKKRKFEFENDAVAGEAENKENLGDAEEEDEESGRMRKRAKVSAPSPARASLHNPSAKRAASGATPGCAAGTVASTAGKTSAATRLPTLGVKPRGAKTVTGGKDARKGGATAKTQEKEKDASSGGAAGGSASAKSTITRERLNALSQPKKRG